jgi:hypothetical protein
MKSEIAAAAASVAAQNLPVRPNYGCQVKQSVLAAAGILRRNRFEY